MIMTGIERRKLQYNVSRAATGRKLTFNLPGCLPAVYLDRGHSNGQVLRSGTISFEVRSGVLGRATQRGDGGRGDGTAYMCSGDAAARPAACPSAS